MTELDLAVKDMQQIPIRGLLKAREIEPRKRAALLTGKIARQIKFGCACATVASSLCVAATPRVPTLSLAILDFFRYCMPVTLKRRSNIEVLRLSRLEVSN